MHKELPGLMAGFYLHGSIALDAFNAHSSDIDFITVVSRRCSTEDIEILRKIYAEVAGKHPRWPLSGSYLQWEDLGQSKNTIVPAPCCHDGVIQPGSHHDINPVTWWVLKNRGISLVGPEPEDLAFTVDWNRLITEMHENLNTYWKTFTRDPRRMSWLLTDFGIEWVVLGILRQCYTFREQDITSKTGAGEYALKHLPPKWHRLIQEAICIREHTGSSAYRSRILRAIEAWSFAKYAIDLGNAAYSSLGYGAV